MPDIEIEEPDDGVLSAGGTGEPFADVVARRWSRRDFLRSTAMAGLTIYLPTVHNRVVPSAESRLGFGHVASTTGDRMALADGHRASVLLRWGDPLFPDAPAFDPLRQTAAAQARQFGYNCDFVGYFPLPRTSESWRRGLLVVNHEYTNPELMFPNYNAALPTAQQVAVQLESLGLSIVEVVHEGGEWRPVLGSPYNRRITGTTECQLTGPALGHRLLRTAADPLGRTVRGTFANCSAGRTPWGTVLSAEENFHDAFGNRRSLTGDDEDLLNHARSGVAIGASKWAWERHDDRFDLGRHPHEPYRFGWVVEVDPYDPKWVPRKRTALGRMRREAANSVVARGGQVALYSGDDTAFEYVYKFVTRGRFNPHDRTANRDLLDEGTLHVARFNANGSGDWLPLVHGQGPLTSVNGLPTQGDVLINTLKSADLVGATKMDRPEDIEIAPDGTVYIALTKNAQRGVPGQPKVDPANPRVENKHGHVIELIEDGDDHAGRRFRWQLFLVCGDPADPTTYFAGYPTTGGISRISCPDNLAFDHAGNLWIATDGQAEAFGINDGLFVVSVDGPERGRVRRFFSAVAGAEVTGHAFTPNDTTLFLSIQHPGEGSTFAAPSSLFPDGTAPPRPSVLAIQHVGGLAIGSAAAGTSTTTAESPGSALR
ncbi:MAG: PhoX family phosphatase [Ardenticatenales bacterium]|nr:PhoX family phosphatase [Ardenticatenales bacterium]